MKRLALLLWLVGLGAGCAHRLGPEDLLGLSDAQLYDGGKQALEAGDEADARLYLERLVRQFPDSPLVPQARLLIADSFYQQDQSSMYEQAELEYKRFVAIYPTHPRVDYAALRAAMTHVERMREADRDQVQTLEAERALQEFLRVYPASPSVEQAREALSRVQGQRAHHDLLVAQHYYKLGIARAAVPRLRSVVERYPRSTVIEEARVLLTKSYLRLWRDSVKMKAPAPELLAQARSTLDQLRQTFPNNFEIAELEQELAEASRNAAPAKPAGSEPRPAAETSAATQANAWSADYARSEEEG